MKRAPRLNEGRPSTYSVELTDVICKRLSEGESLRQICKDKNMPVQSTVYLWLLDENKKEFSEKYAAARNSQAEVLFDEILEIADDGTNDYMARELDSGTIEVLNSEHIQRSRLRVDTRKWYLSKVLPKKYGEKIDVDHSNKGEKFIFVPTELLTKHSLDESNTNTSTGTDSE